MAEEIRDPFLTPGEIPGAGAPGNEKKPPGGGRRLARRLALGLVLVLLVVGVGAVIFGFWFRGRMEASLPLLDGGYPVAGLETPVRVARDSLGVPVIEAASRADAARALGFLHGQDRFFQMDLQRRKAAGELAELFGEVALPADRIYRMYRFRSIAREAFEREGPAGKALIEAYGEGVNAGLGALGAPPFEYLVLRTDPAPWRPEDTYLTVLAMYIALQDPPMSAEATLTVMRETLPQTLFDFLVPPGTEWDAPLIGPAFTTPPVPGPEVIDVRGGPGQPSAPAEGTDEGPDEEEEERKAAEFRWPWSPPMPATERLVPGSNSWAVSGSHTTHGGALVANDMHLPLGMPHIWYRADLHWPGEDGQERHLTGVTLPGTPLVVVGSNTHIAWGFTNSQTDTSDLVVLEPGEEEDTYLTPDGPVPFEHHEEILAIHGGGEERLRVITTRWGPVLPEKDLLGRRLAVRWVVQEPEALNLTLMELEAARDVDTAVAVANRGGLPAQNFVVADETGRIAWSLAGAIPRRVGFDGRTATSWADGTHRWEGVLAPEELPRLLDPENGRLWTANNRTVDGEDLARLGDADFVDGARAGQIRDRLLAADTFTAADMLAIQLDDRALFLERWHRLLEGVLTPRAIAADPRRAEVLDLAREWNGHASVDRAAYQIVRVFRHTVAEAAFAPLIAPARAIDPKLPYPWRTFQHEGPLWRLVMERPAHLLDPKYESWDALLLAAVDETVRLLTADGGSLGEKTWGRRNTLRMRHPLSFALPLLGRWLDMPAAPLPGDAHMPRVQSPTFGASERLAVSPGREGEAIFHMPGGQSGHPLSPHYGDSHRAWAEGRATPFLPGEAVHVLALVPGGDQEAAGTPVP